MNTKKIQWGRRRIKHEKRFNGGKKKIVVRNQETDDLSSLDFEQYIQESAEISLQTTTLY